MYVLYITWRKGPSENRQEGEDGDNHIMYMHVLYILLGGRGRARIRQEGEDGDNCNLSLFCAECNGAKPK